MQGSDQPPVITLDLPAPDTMAGDLTDGSPTGPVGSNVTNLASNRGLTREKQSLQVDAPAMMCRRDHLMVSAIVLSAPAIAAGPFRMDHPRSRRFQRDQPRPQPSLHEGERTMGRRRTRHAQTHTAREAKIRDTGAEDNGEDHTLSSNGKTCKFSATKGRMEAEVG
ncbi:hypothetical protein F511_32051 [Dorcoceras hygrometricum]|uniref:Uncharacterized protein n=1 Tax=Dorcoceras hygrometricum TaxID=472368 RepID=A0A2Z7CSL5_9LAMI|nr:hypothetical protein F511_32051 [Dorcoceras hygrometricum]